MRMCSCTGGWSITDGELFIVNDVSILIANDPLFILLSLAFLLAAVATGHAFIDVIFVEPQCDVLTFFPVS